MPVSVPVSVPVPCPHPYRVRTAAFIFFLLHSVFLWGGPLQIFFFGLRASASDFFLGFEHRLQTFFSLEDGITNSIAITLFLTASAAKVFSFAIHGAAKSQRFAFTILLRLRRLLKGLPEWAWGYVKPLLTFTLLELVASLNRPLTSMLSGSGGFGAQSATRELLLVSLRGLVF